MKDLNKLAEEWLDTNRALFVRKGGQFDGLVDWPLLIQAFHKHALKAHLDEWTDEKIEQEFYRKGRTQQSHRLGVYDGAITFRDELKKEIGE